MNSVVESNDPNNYFSKKKSSFSDRRNQLTLDPNLFREATKLTSLQLIDSNSKRNKKETPHSSQKSKGILTHRSKPTIKSTEEPKQKHNPKTILGSKVSL